MRTKFEALNPLEREIVIDAVSDETTLYEVLGYFRGLLPELGDAVELREAAQRMVSTLVREDWLQLMSLNPYTAERQVVPSNQIAESLASVANWAAASTEWRIGVVATDRARSAVAPGKAPGER